MPSERGDCLLVGHGRRPRQLVLGRQRVQPQYIFLARKTTLKIHCRKDSKDDDGPIGNLEETGVKTRIPETFNDQGAKFAYRSIDNSS